ncbi:uncharacterized protein CEXT_223401 [Caerostris extrusa]|uniref:Uncharacterized protein n=1 Tax=Caerostris extrusa TaxID=172846 RepID=A0AAV4YD09_CAEEX|nr:uncharacterized protein CEXT_223401 [Caerostris extrusa]
MVKFTALGVRMEIKVILLLTAISIIDAGLLNTAYYPKSFYGGFSYSPSYDAHRNYNTAKYYAKKSYDLARLNAGIYGLEMVFMALGMEPFYNLRFSDIIHNRYYPQLVKDIKSNIFNPASIHLYFQQAIPTFLRALVAPIRRAMHLDLDSVHTHLGINIHISSKVHQLTKGTPLNTFTGYDSIYGTRYNKFPPKLPAIGSKILPPYKGFPVGGVSIVKDPFQFNPNYGVRFDDYRSRQLVQTNRDPPWNNFPSSPVLGNAGYSLIPPVGDFSAGAPSYEYYTDPFNEYAARSDNDAARSDNNAARSDNELARSFKYDESTKKASDKPDLVAHGSIESKAEDMRREFESSSKTE